jgi:hypothetical protein
MKIQLKIARVIYFLSLGYSKVIVDKINIILVKMFLASNALPQRLEHEKQLLQMIKYFYYWIMNNRFKSSLESDTIHFSCNI